MKPYSVDWVAGSNTYFASAISFSQDIPVSLETNSRLFPLTLYGFTSAYVQANMQPPFGLMPNGAAYQVTITSADDLSGNQFVISGFNQDGFFVSEAVTGPDAATVTSANYYTMFNIVPNIDSALTETISVGMSANGFTAPFEVDTWNKASLLSFEISKVIGTVSITEAQMTNDTPFETVDQTVVPNARTWFEMLAEENITTLATFPITTNEMFSFRDYPVCGVRFEVGAATTGTFTYTILQQGAKY
jgi:hypothetical protein